MFDFQLELDAVDEVPEGLRPIYIKSEDGKFRIESALAKKLDVTGLTTALDKERKANKTVKDQLEAWKKLNVGVTPEEAATKLQELTERATNGDGKANWDKMKRDLEESHNKTLGLKDQEVHKMVGTVEKYLIDSEATKALADLKGSPALLLPHVRAQVKVVEQNGEYITRVVDKDGDPRGDGRGGFMTIKDLVSEMKASAEYGRAFESSGSTGGGKPPSSSKSGQDALRNGELSPTQKIAAGLKKGLLTYTG